jgi:hypothetical protein
MNRSSINEQMDEALALMAMHQFHLPPFATWSPAVWRDKGLECAGIIRQQLGWDITDFGSGNFEAVGLVLFTIRNGMYDLVKCDPMAKAYAEKIMIVRESQITPIHLHYNKTEDIINRGGGVLVIQLWNSTAALGLDNSGSVSVDTDGVRRQVPAGGLVELMPGESITLPHGLYHKFWGKTGCGTVLVGEVSRVCDEYSDNKFFEPIGRFADITEDVQPRYLLFDDYQRYYPHFIAARENTGLEQ